MVDPDVVLTAMGDVFLDRLEESYKSLFEVDAKAKVDPANKFIGFDAYKKLTGSGCCHSDHPPASGQI
jgi:hypothetical protein